MSKMGKLNMITNNVSYRKGGKQIICIFMAKCSFGGKQMI